MTLDELYAATLTGDKDATRCVALMARWSELGENMSMRDAMELRDLITDLGVDLYTGADEASWTAGLSEEM